MNIWWSGEAMCSDPPNGELNDLKVKIEVVCPNNGEAATSDIRHPSSDILETLTRFDQQGFFMNPMDVSTAPTNTNNLMCFAKMREKVDTAQYKSWTSFVKDFESICHKALEQSPANTEKWNAADLLLRQGSRYLEQQQQSTKCKAGGIGDLEDKPSTIGGEPGLPHTNKHCNGNLVPVCADKEMKLENNTLEREGHHGRHDKDSSVDILELTPGGDMRTNFDDSQATDCSSSFGHTENDPTDCEADSRSCEVESELRNGNGAKESMEGIVSPRRKKRLPNLEWKSYRQGIEWRCRWLELRVKELRAKASKYDRILVTATSRKGEEMHHQQGDNLAARTLLAYPHLRNRVLQRRRRRKDEERMDSKSQMSRHPVFSRYEKKKQRNQEEISEELMKDENYRLLEFDDLNLDLVYLLGDECPVQEDSIEQFLWHIEALQMRVSKLTNQLIGGTSAQRDVSAQSRDVASPDNLALHGSSTSPGHLTSRGLIGNRPHGGKSTSRKRNYDLDDSLIIPDTAMAKYVEPAIHAFIETPRWRELGILPASDKGGSSDEDTDDEVYNKRHATEGHKLHEPASCKAQDNRRSITDVKPTPDLNLREDVQNFPTSFALVSKRKRRRRESRDIALLAKNIEPLLNASHQEASQESLRNDRLMGEDNMNL